MPDRMLYEKLTKSEALASCSREADLAFPRFLLATDLWGRFEAHPGILRSKLWPIRDDVTASDVAGCLEEYERVGCIQTWVVDGKWYGRFLNFDLYQREKIRWRGQKSIYPDPPGWDHVPQRPRLVESPEQGSTRVVPMPPQQKSSAEVVDSAMYRRYREVFPRGTDFNWQKILEFEDLGEGAILAALDASYEAGASWPAYALKTLASIRSAGSLEEWRLQGSVVSGRKKSAGKPAVLSPDDDELPPIFANRTRRSAL